MFGLGPMEIAICAVILVILFGPSRLPKLAYGIGNSLTSFKRGVSGVEDDLKDAEREIRNTARDAERAIKDA